jgi:hypothetical protein
MRPATHATIEVETPPVPMLGQVSSRWVGIGSQTTTMNHPQGHAGWWRGAGWTSLVSLGMAALALLPGCSLLRAPEKVAHAIVPGKSSRQFDPVELQVQVQRFADDYALETATALDECVRRMGTDAARAQGLRWKLAATTAALGFASGPQPKANLLDLVSMATMNRAALEEYALNPANRAAVQPWLETSRVLETNAWVLADRVLSPAQVEELRAAITQWQKANPGAQNVFAARPQEFASMVKTSQGKETDVSSVFSLVGLDPTSGLDPAVHEITLTRLFAERAMYTLQRMPQVLRWQTELLTYQVTEQPGVQTVLSNTTRLGESMDRISRAAESVSQTAARLPDQIAAERKALVAALDQQEGKLRELAAEVDRALVSADKMSGSLTVTITNFDALMKRFGVGEPATNSPPDTNSRPFNVLDYGQTATQIAGMARDLNALIASVNQSVPQLERLGQKATADAQRVVDRSFRLGLVLIGVLLVGAVVCGLAYRFVAGKLNRAEPPPPAGTP